MIFYSREEDVEMSMIDIDYNDVIRKAKRLEELADELESLAASQMQSVVDKVPRAGSWTGTAAEMYQRKVRTVKDQIKAHAQSLRGKAKSLRGTAENYQRLEQMNPFMR